MATYDKGDLVRLSATFRDSAGTLADPTTVTLEITSPAGTLTTPTPAKDSVGQYHYDLAVTLSGTWWHRWEGTGAIIAAAESSFLAQRSNFA